MTLSGVKYLEPGASQTPTTGVSFLAGNGEEISSPTESIPEIQSSHDVQILNLALCTLGSFDLTGNAGSRIHQ